MTHLPTVAGVTDPGSAVAAIFPVQPVVTTTSSVDSWTVHLGPVKATVIYEFEPENWSTIYVDDALAEGVDQQLATLAERERNLGDDRWLSRDIDPQVDDLYDRLNERIATTKTMVTMAVLPLLGDVLDHDSRLLDKVEFDAYAGCASCKCSPGVKAPYARRYGAWVQISINLA